ncbi:MAG TPA: cation:proton antiporter [Flavisolibacter sp.]|nr:cation:proton antiporter [Flavisolibacter sp.]
MTIPFIIAICILLLVAYAFDISSARTRIPSVILLLLMGWLVKLIASYFDIIIPDHNAVMPIFGTLGLILIVLEGSLELEFTRSKLGFIGKSALVALLPILVLSFGLGFAFHYFGNTSFKTGLSNAIPFAIISSSVAIPSARNLPGHDREFVTYESSLSDIFGVLFFNFITLNDDIQASSVGHFFLELFIILVVSFIATLSLAFLLNRIKHHVKFVPIILMIFLIYALAKLYHLPGLIFILLFGIFLGNLDELKHLKFVNRLKPDILNREVQKLKELTMEGAFLIRALFFLLFGFLIETDELFNGATMAWAVGISLGIFLLRYLFLKLFRLPVSPLLFVAPRGLITILLFLSIPTSQVISLSNKSLIIQVIVLTALVMMIGLITNKPRRASEQPK